MFKKIIILILIGQNLLCFVSASFADEVIQKNPLSAALKSAVLPGWGQYENKENEKGGRVIGKTLVNGLAYYYLSEVVKDKENKKVSLDDKYPDIVLRDYCGVMFVGNYLGSVVDAYISAQNINNKNDREKKDVGTAMWLTVLLPGLGHFYVGDDISGGIDWIFSDLYWLDKWLFGKTELNTNNGIINADKFIGGWMYSLSLIGSLVGTYFQCIAHNEKDEKITFQMYPKANFLTQQLSITFHKDF